MSFKRRTCSSPAISGSGFGRSPRRPRPLHPKPTVEVLEDRLAPATFAPLAATLDGIGNGSLRDDISTANENTDVVNVFNLQADIYQLAIPNGAGGQENAAATGDLDLVNLRALPSKTYLFQGAGAGVTVIDGGDLDRVFHIPFGGVSPTVIFRDLTIRNGTAQDDGTAGRLPGSSTAEGGGIEIKNGSVTLENVILELNVAQGGTGEGGINPGQNGTPGQDALGGGVFTIGALVVRNSTITANHALGGDGGQSAYEFAGNGGNALGGGIFSHGRVTFTNSTLSSNQVQGGRGGEGRFGGNGGSSDGGGLYSRALLQTPTCSLRNSTVVDNIAFSTHGGVSAGGSSDGFDSFGHGGGVYAENPITAVSSIIAVNFSDPTNSTDFDVHGAFASASTTLLETAAGATGIANGVNGNLVGVSPNLGPLQFNGGPTPTHALLPGSPAINAGSNPDGLTTDQRGFARTFDGATDIGAFEVAPPPAPPPAPRPPAPRPPAPPAPLQLIVVVFKRRHKAKVLVVDAATGTVRAVLTPFRGFRGRLRLELVDINGDGSRDLVVRATINGKRTVKIFDAVTLSLLPVPRRHPARHRHGHRR